MRSAAVGGGVSAGIALPSKSKGKCQGGGQGLFGIPGGLGGGTLGCLGWAYRGSGGGFGGSGGIDARMGGRLPGLPLPFPFQAGALGFFGLGLGRSLMILGLAFPLAAANAAARSCQPLASAAWA